MKLLKILLLSCSFQLLIFNCSTCAASIIDVDEIIPDNKNEIFNYLPSETLPPNQIKDLIEEIEEDTYIYNIDMYNLNAYNLVSLENADIRCHVRGSIWIGGTLTGSQYIDDGSLNGESPSNSYVYENQSTIYFKSRTIQQSQDAYYKLAAQSVIDTTNYWQNILSILPKNSEYIKYVEPDVNGYVNLQYWNYQSPGSDSAISTIPILYWTDATKIDMGGLAGHLIAPYADIYITYCNHCGSIVGKNISTDGESHLNYWIPVIETEIETEPIIETETELITEIITESEPESEIITEQSETKIIIESESESNTLIESESEQKKETEPITEKQTEKLTEKITQKQQTEKPTEKITEKQTEKITEEKATQKQTERTTEKITQKQTERQNRLKPLNTLRQTEKITEGQTETSSGEVLGVSRERKKSKIDETYELEADKKKESGIKGAVRETEPTELFGSLIESIFIPKTGDTTPLFYLILLLSLSSISILIFIIILKKK